MSRNEANHPRCEEKVTRYGEQVAKSDEQSGRTGEKARNEANHPRCEGKVTRYEEQVARSDEQSGGTDEKVKICSVTNLKKLFFLALFKSNAELAGPEDIRRQSIGERGL